MKRAQQGCHSILFLNPLVYFFPVNYGLLGGLDAEPYLFALNVNDADLDVITNGDALSQLPCQYEHGYLPWYAGVNRS